MHSTVCGRVVVGKTHFTVPPPLSILCSVLSHVGSLNIDMSVFDRPSSLRQAPSSSAPELDQLVCMCACLSLLTHLEPCTYMFGTALPFVIFTQIVTSVYDTNVSAG